MNEIIKDIISSLESFKDDKRIEFAKTSYPKTLMISTETSTTGYQWIVMGPILLDMPGAKI